MTRLCMTLTKLGLPLPLSLTRSLSLSLTLALALSLIAAPARAMYCTPLGSTGLVLGYYQPQQLSALDAQTSFAIECFPSVPGENLNLKVRLANAGNGRLLVPLTGTSTGSLLAVQLYRDAARSVPLDEQSAISYSDHPMIPTLYWVSLYARVPAAQDVGTGLYRMPLTVLIDY